MHRPDVELLWWEGCPSTEQALRELREALRGAGLGELEVRMTEMRTGDDVQAEAFVGSPTIRIDGEDVAPPGPDEPVGLTCRVYHRPDGRVSPTPGSEQLSVALRRAPLGVDR